MPEIEYDELKNRLSQVPAKNRDAFLEDVKKAGYTWTLPEQKAQDTGEALLTNKPTQGLKQEFVRSLPATGGMIAGASAGAATGAELGTFLGPVGTAVGGLVGGVAGAALGSGAGELGRQAIAQGTAKAFPQEKYPVLKTGKLMEAVGKSAKEGAEGELTGQVLSAGISKVAAPVAKKAYGLLAEKWGGIADYAVNAAEKNAPKVLKYARMGIEGASEAAAETAKKFGSAIRDFEKSLSKRYVEDVIENGIKKVGETTPIEFTNRMQPAIEGIRSEFVFDPGEEKVFDKVVEKYEKGISKSPLPQAGEPIRPDQYTVGDAYKFQKFLNGAIERARGKRALYSGLLDLKGAVVDSFEPVLPELQAGNTVYREGRNIVKSMSKVDKADDVAQAISTALRKRGKTRDALMEFIKRSPECKEILDDFISAQAGKEFAYWTVQSPKTGFRALHTAAPAASVAVPIATHHPLLAAPALAAYYATTSPRLYGAGYAAGPTIRKMAAGAARQIPRFLHKQLSPQMEALIQSRENQ